MSRIEGFAATVGVLLMENIQCVPWQAPLPPLLSAARGWYRPLPAGPSVLLVMGADKMTPAVLDATRAAWHSWLGDLNAADSALILVWEEGFPAEESPLYADGLDSWQTWAVDLPTQRVEFSGFEQADQAFTQHVQQGVNAYFEGVQLTPADLEEQETASLEGKVPFEVFLAAQSSPATWGLLALIGAYFLLPAVLDGNAVYRMLRAGANYRPLIEQGEIWRLVTANFLHFGWVHLLVNAFSLFAVGPMLEKVFGTRKFLAIYLVSGVTGAVASFLFNQAARSAGASGALFGLLGAMLILGLLHPGSIPDHQRRTMRDLAFITLALNLGFSLLTPIGSLLGFGSVGPHIDNYSHLGGLAGGCLMAAMLGPHPTLMGKRLPRWMWRGLWVFPVVAGLGLAGGLWYTLSGKVPEMRMLGPTSDYMVTLPLSLDTPTTDQFLFATADNNVHWVEVTSIENWAGLPTPDRRALVEDNLDLYAGLLASKYATQGARLAESPAVILRGRHRFLRIRLTTREGRREETYVTASNQRIYAIRTRGLETEPWVRPTLDRVLATFEMITS